MARVLIVDDKEDNAYYLNALLTGSGYGVESARNGADALEKARRSPPDLVISDLLMPGMDGYTLLRCWKADAQLKRVPFIVHTATYTDPDDVELALSLGADAFLIKPMEPEEFIARVKEVEAQAATAEPVSPAKPAEDEAALLKVYNTTLIRKLEKKTMQLEAANRALIRDISERELVEISLKESEERFHELAENINEVFWVSDVHRHLIDYVSPAYEKIWGRPCEALYADPNTWLEAIHPEDQERVYKAAVAWQTEGAYDEEYRIVRPDETVRWIHDSGFPVRDGEGKVKRMVGVARDITENRELEEQFRQIQKMEAIGQLAGGVAHDFNNMLAVIAMQAGLLGADKSLSARQAELVRDMEAVVQRGADLTRQLLVFSRRQTMQPQDLDMNVIVTNVGKMIWRILGEDIRMQVNVASQPMYVNADAGMMDQVLMNLTVNARDAMPEGGTLIIGTSAVSFQESDKAKFPQTRPGSFVCLSVRDRGCGIAPENLTRIFEPFFTTKEVGKGTGLGLATVFGIVHQHQGWISVESEVGDGTTFRVYLPAVSSPEGVASAQPAETAALGGKETILMVEDDPSLRGFVRMTLSRLGYRVLEAATGAGALEAWKQNRAEIRLLLTDMVLPGGMTGRELAQRLLEEKPGLQIIYVSGYSAETAVKDLCLEEGVNFLRKPFKAQKLAQTLRAKLDASGV